MRCAVGVLGALALAACNGGEGTIGAPTPGGAQAAATLRTTAGAEAGMVKASDVVGGMRVTVEVAGLPAGTHGVHIHTVGRCVAPDFATAGGHWNPTQTKHGSMNPQGPHQGDLPNLIVGADGRGTVAATIPGASIAAMLDADGAAFVVHAAADDLMTDPSGNSGGRIACGVFQAG